MLNIITGPPAAGKTHHVATHAQPGDIVIDLDRLACALTVGTGTHDYPDHIRDIARAARYTALKAAVPHHRAGRSVWVIDTAPSRATQRWYRTEGARVVHLDPGGDVLAQRLAARTQGLAEGEGGSDLYTEDP